MGARISIQFEKDNEKSVVLFSHWGGEEFGTDAEQYAEQLKAEIADNNGVNPIDRLEPNTVMVDFIRSLTKDMPRVEGDLYLGVDEDDGDNSDYGHKLISLD
jgi:hypothetical protein